MREPNELGHPVKFSKSIIGLFQKGCWHIPEVMGASFLALIGIGLAAAGCYKYVERNGDNKEYKSVYVIVRPGDPRECNIINPVFTEYKC